MDDVDVDGASDPAHAPASVGAAAVGGRVVSTVDGHPITVDQVAAAARAAGVTPEVALRRLQDEALLGPLEASEVGLIRGLELRRVDRVGTDAPLDLLCEERLHHDLARAAGALVHPRSGSPRRGREQRLVLQPAQRDLGRDARRARRRRHLVDG
ncbi:MAG: hypothetical protein EVA89_20500, partial [Sandaracinaceae bacterium]